jgi:poly(hydroxyalkanoate) depolymerase family esterase
MMGPLAMAAIVGLSAAPVRAAEDSGPDTTHPSTANGQTGRWIEGTFTSPMGTRRYQLYVPGGYDPARRHMLVVMLHGCTQDAADFARGTRIAEHAERGRFLALLPEQPETAHPKKCWNWYEPANQSRGAGEPAMLDGIISQVMRDRAVDSTRVHLAGISAGAAMASLLAVAYPERFASIALHSGMAWRPATDVMTALAVMGRGAADADTLGGAALAAMGDRARVVPALVVHGSKDVVLNPLNGKQTTRQWIITNTRAPRGGPLTASVTAGTTNGYHWTRACHRSGAGACVVEEWIVDELGHAWSGGSAAGTFTDEHGPDLTAEMLRFFGEHPLPAR